MHPPGDEADRSAENAPELFTPEGRTLGLGRFRFCFLSSFKSKLAALVNYFN
jgi:hypothetical protein